jgi:L-threonylcarbamoyladenylate synthase
MHPLEPLIVHLKKGLPAMLPFDTCYGFVCDGTRREACALLYDLKGRPANQPSALVLPDVAMIEEFAEVSPIQRRILKDLLPGGVTVIMRLKDGVDLPGGYVQTKYRTASFRVVRSTLMDEVLSRFKKPLLATSANYHFKPVVLSRTDMVLQPFDHRLLDQLYRMDNEVYQKPTHSTVIDLTTDEPEIVRPGVVPAERIRLAALR